MKTGRTKNDSLPARFVFVRLDILRLAVLTSVWYCNHATAKAVNVDFYTPPFGVMNEMNKGCFSITY